MFRNASVLICCLVCCAHGWSLVIRKNARALQSCSIIHTWRFQRVGYLTVSSRASFKASLSSRTISTVSCCIYSYVFQLRVFRSLSLKNVSFPSWNCAHCWFSSIISPTSRRLLCKTLGICYYFSSGLLDLGCILHAVAHRLLNVNNKQKWVSHPRRTTSALLILALRISTPFSESPSTKNLKCFMYHLNDKNIL